MSKHESDQNIHKRKSQAYVFLSTPTLLVAAMITATAGSNLPQSGSHGTLLMYCFAFALLTFIFSYYLFAECAWCLRSHHTCQHCPTYWAWLFSSCNALKCCLFTFINILGDEYLEGSEPEGWLRAKRASLHQGIIQTCLHLQVHYPLHYKQHLAIHILHQDSVHLDLCNLNWNQVHRGWFSVLQGGTTAPNWSPHPHSQSPHTPHQPHLMYSHQPPCDWCPLWTKTESSALSF